MLQLLLLYPLYCILYCTSRFEERIWPLWKSWGTERHRAGPTVTLATRTICSETSRMLFWLTDRYFIRREFPKWTSLWFLLKWTEKTESVIKIMDKNAQTGKCWITVQKRSAMLCLQFYICIATVNITRYTIIMQKLAMLYSVHLSCRKCSWWTNQQGLWFMNEA